MRSLILSINVREDVFEHPPQQCINTLPVSLREDVLKYKYNRMRWMSYFGKLLLVKGLSLLNKSTLLKNPLQYNDYKRPFLSNTLDFNISHSGNSVVCAITNSGKVGVDVQERNRVIKGNKSMFLSDLEQEAAAYSTEWDLIEAWCKKEAVSKAIGKGLQLSFREINTLEYPINKDTEDWYLSSIPITTEYVCYLATNLAENDISLLKYKLDIEQFLKINTL